MTVLSMKHVLAFHKQRIKYSLRFLQRVSIVLSHLLNNPCTDSCLFSSCKRWMVLSLRNMSRLTTYWPFTLSEHKKIRNRLQPSIRAFSKDAYKGS